MGGGGGGELGGGGGVKGVCLSAELVNAPGDAIVF